MNKICYIFRKSSPAFHSIEEVFATVIPEVGKRYETSSLELPHPPGFRGVIRNLLSFRREKDTIYHITGQEYYMALRTGKNTVLTIHDIGSAFSGNLLRNRVVRIFWFRIPALIARRITVISEFSKGEFLKLVPYAAPKTRVIPDPLNSLLHYTPKPFSSGKPVILLMGTKPNKNLERIIPALQDISCRLVIVGKLCKKQLFLLNECGFILNPDPLPPKGGLNSVITDIRSPLGDLGVRSEIRNFTLSGVEGPKSQIRNQQSEIRNTFEVFHSLPYSEITALYEACDLVCFASTYEGFGVPILEAQAVGRPVITARAASMPEVAGDGACMVDPFSVDSIREGVLRVIGDAAYREELVQRGLKNVERFRVEKITGEYREVYQEIHRL